MGKMARTIVVSGYYGFNNSGDEAVLHAIVTALRDEAQAAGAEARIVVLSGDPAETARLHGVETAHRMRPLAVLGALRRADALISGGGSLLQDVTSAKSVLYYLAVLKLARWMRVPTFIYAQGVGPIRDRGRFGPMIRSAFEASRYVSVRDDESKELVASFGVAPERIDVVPDPVMGMGLSLPSTAAVTTGAGVRLGVSVRFWRDDRQELERLAAGLALVLEEREDAKVALLPFHLPSDKLASEFVADRLVAAGFGPDRVEVHAGASHPKDMLSEVAGCDALIGMRLHSLIYAATAGVPPIAVSYDPKIDQFMRRLGESPVGDTDSLDADALAAAVLGRLELGKTAWYGEKRAAIEEMQQNSRAPAQQIFRELRI
ncbi:polysaccharide pyruvyl transferase CsaB [Paenibacillus antri]|uniref:Polysaccharide pyruvyl transferase CsaB n=2 Tax=Paenibacillus antri TaxID=2582848 RepID=A0A5R9G671_9BACL|nr:polysaccharide pyruvyl transferase CsaB [Paenibacillus antri]TLS50549.1 polysaccharide pyruvyl transferase CsaB [Paenibacillus antri]